MQHIIVIKIGTNALMEGGPGHFIRHLQCFVDQIMVGIQNRKVNIVLITSGAVGSARLQNIPGSKRVLASVGQIELMKRYQDAFGLYHKQIGQVLITRQDLAHREHYLHVRETILEMLEHGIVPILNNNDVLVKSSTTISDNDQLACYISGMLGAEKCIIVSNVDGLYTGKPGAVGVEKISHIETIDDTIRSYIQSDTSSGGTGGMASKLKAGLLLQQFGIDMYLTSLQDEKSITTIIQGEHAGTHVVAPKTHASLGIQSWISAGAVPVGVIIVDEPLEVRLQISPKPSLLLVGIHSMQGNFDKNQVVEIQGISGTVLGYGMSKLSSNELQQYFDSSITLPKNTIVLHANYYFLTKGINFLRN